MIIIWGWGALEADFIREYSIDINDPAWQAKTSFRKLCVLIKGLSPDSAFSRFVNNKKNYQYANLK